MSHKEYPGNILTRPGPLNKVVHGVEKNPYSGKEEFSDTTWISHREPGHPAGPVIHRGPFEKYTREKPIKIPSRRKPDNRVLTPPVPEEPKNPKSILNNKTIKPALEISGKNRELQPYFMIPFGIPEGIAHTYVEPIEIPAGNVQVPKQKQEAWVSLTTQADLVKKGEPKEPAQKEGNPLSEKTVPSSTSTDSTKQEDEKSTSSKRKKSGKKKRWPIIQAVILATILATGGGPAQKTSGEDTKSGKGNIVPVCLVEPKPEVFIPVGLIGTPEMTDKPKTSAQKYPMPDMISVSDITRLGKDDMPPRQPREKSAPIIPEVVDVEPEDYLLKISEKLLRQAGIYKPDEKIPYPEAAAAALRIASINPPSDENPNLIRPGKIKTISIDELRAIHSTYSQDNTAFDKALDWTTKPKALKAEETVKKAISPKQ